MTSPEPSHSRFARLRARLSGGVGAKLLGFLERPSLSDEDWDNVEATLLQADIGPSAADEVIATLRSSLKRDHALTPRDALRAALLAVLDPGRDRSLAVGPPGAGGAEAIVVVGVNGVGKTTTVGKLARLLVADGYGVLMAAADTFRAAAADQLQTWGARAGVEVVRGPEGGDPAAVAFEGAERAITSGADVLIIDTAGRLQNKKGLMDELAKIFRVLSRHREPAEVLLVLDATTGQNGLEQARVFSEVTRLTGIVLTKLDGTAKGGIVVAVERELGIPVKFVGLGEQADDLAPFDPEAFVDGILA